VSVLVLVVDDEPDVQELFRQKFRRDLREQRFLMDFAVSAKDALSHPSSREGHPSTAGWISVFSYRV
jgi:hypothetical protein